MRTFKGMIGMRAIVLFCGLGLIAGAAVAQDDAPTPPPPGSQMQGPPPGGHHRDGPAHRVDRMKHELSLTDDQTTQVKAAFEDSGAKMEALKADTSISHKDRRTQMMAIHQAEEDKIHSILTPDQTTKYDAMQSKMREKMKARREAGAAQAPGDTTPPPPPQN